MFVWRCSTLKRTALCSPHRHNSDGVAQVSMDETLNLHHGEVEVLGSIPKCHMQGVAEGVVTATSGAESLRGIP